MRDFEEYAVHWQKFQTGRQRIYPSYPVPYVPFFKWSTLDFINLHAQEYSVCFKT